MRIDKIGDFVRRRHGRALDQDDMQPDLQSRQATRPGDGIRRIRFADHQAGARQEPIPMSGLDRVVYREIEAEIICREDDLFQLAT
jgi:hypothetical protein